MKKQKKKSQEKRSNPSFTWSTRELKTYIREQTREVNKRINSYRESVAQGNIKENRQIEQQIARLVAFGTGTRGKDGEVQLGLSNKRKDALLMQAKGLERYIRWETGSVESDSKRKEQLIRQYEGYKRATGTNISFESYISLAETWGSVGNSIIHDFGYENLGNIIEIASDDEIKDLTPIMLEVEAESKGQGWTMEQMLDRLYDKITGPNRNV